ncbi:hypothetical protein ES705_27525 [subsurface metagenome]
MKTIGELEVTDNKKLVLSIGEYQGGERIDARGKLQCGMATRFCKND